jgi:hypothetical protein
MMTSTLPLMPVQAHVSGLHALLLLQLNAVCARALLI